MIEVEGDLWEYPAQVRAITTNGTVKKDGTAVMGAGCALEAKERFSGIDETLGGLLAAHGNRCFRIVAGEPPVTLLTFPVKHAYSNKADPQLVADSCMQAMKMADKFEWNDILVPRPGSGFGGLDYDTEVKEIVSMLLDDRFKVITNT